MRLSQSWRSMKKTRRFRFRKCTGKILFSKTGGVDGCDCDEILKLIEQGRIDTTPLITHTFPLEEIEQAYDIFENRKDNVIKIAVSHI